MFFNRNVDKQQTDVLMEWGPAPRLFRKRKTRLRLEFNSGSGIFAIYAMRGKTHERIVFRETCVDSVYALVDGPCNVVMVKSRVNVCTLVAFDVWLDKPRVEWWRLESDAVLEYTVALNHVRDTHLLLPLYGDGEVGAAPLVAVCHTRLGDLVPEKRPPIKPFNILNTALYDIPYLDDVTNLARIHDPSTRHTRYAVVTGIHQTIARDDITNEWTRQLSFTHPPYTFLKTSEWRPIARTSD